MAFLQNTAYEARVANNALDKTAQIAGLFQADDGSGTLVNADCSAGFLCVRNGRAPNDGFDDPAGTRVYNENAWLMKAAEASDSEIYACDTHDWPLLNAPGGQRYAVGTETLGLGAGAGRWCNFTHIDFDNRSIHRFGIGNLSAAPGSNGFFTVSGGLLVPAASAPTAAGSVFFELLDTGNFVTGNCASFGYVEVMARRA